MRCGIAKRRIQRARSRKVESGCANARKTCRMQVYANFLVDLQVRSNATFQKSHSTFKFAFDISKVAFED